MSPCPDLGKVTITATLMDHPTLTVESSADARREAADYLWRTIDDRLTRDGFWYDGHRVLKREARRVRMARKKRRGWL